MSTQIKTEMPGPQRMEQLIAICEKAACDESPEYVLAATLTGAADEAGITPDGDDFETRCNQRKVFTGRVIEIIRERGLLCSGGGVMTTRRNFTPSQPRSEYEGRHIKFQCVVDVDLHNVGGEFELKDAQRLLNEALDRGLKSNDPNDRS